MRNFLYGIIGILTIIIIYQIIYPHSSNKFPQLIYRIDPNGNWPDTSKYDDFIFQFYSPDIGKNKPWQLLSYKQMKHPAADPSSLIYPLPPDTLKILKDHKDVHDTVVLGNNMINTRLLRYMIDSSEPATSKSLLFTPTDTLRNQYLVYGIYVVQYDSATNKVIKYLSIDTSKLPVKYRLSVVKDANGYANAPTNPCPPATMIISLPDPQLKIKE